MLSHMDYEKLLAQVIQLVEDAGRLLIAEWQRPEGPRGSGDKADVDVEIEDGVVTIRAEAKEEEKR